MKVWKSKEDFWDGGIIREDGMYSERCMGENVMVRACERKGRKQAICFWTTGRHADWRGESVLFFFLLLLS